MRVTLRGIVLNDYEAKKDGWIARFTLKLFDEEKRIVIPEYFDFYASSSEEKLKSIEKGLGVSVASTGIVLDGSLDILGIVETTQSKFGKLRFENWDNFYQQMEQHFIYVD